jgi:hypothetical protein
MALRVKEAHSFDHQGVPVTMRVGALVPEDDPRVIGRERFYEPADAAAARDSTTSTATETTSAGPGERRTRRVVRDSITAD